MQPGGGVSLDEGLQVLGLGEGDEIARDEEFLVQPGGGVADPGLVFVRAEDESDGRLIARGLHVVLPVVQIKIHLPGVAMFEGADFEVDEQMAAEEAVVEDEVDVVVLFADGDALLPGLEAEAGAEFEQEGLQVIEESCFEVFLQVVRLFGQPDELENVGIADDLGDRLRSLRRLLVGVGEHGLLVGGKAGALIKQGADLALEFAHRPATFEALVLVKQSLPGIVKADELDKL